MKNTCCPQHAIRCRVPEFHASKSQKATVNKFVKFITEGGKEGEKGFGGLPATPLKKSLSSSTKGKGKHQATEFDLVQAFASVEYDAVNPLKTAHLAHRFEVTLEPASFTEEKYALYKKYQMQVHKDAESKVTRQGFTRFLCEGPLVVRFLFPSFQYKV